MNMPVLYTMQSEDENLDLGVAYAASEQILRLFGSSYMRDSQTTGTLKILDPQGTTIATFDIWQCIWVETADRGA